MIVAVIIFVALIIIIPAADNGQWGVVLLFAGIAAVLLLMGASERKDTRAWINRRNYWADGGPDRKKPVQATRTHYMSMSGEPSSREKREAARKRAAYVEAVRNGEIKKEYVGPARVCHYCGRMVHARGRRVMTPSGAAIEYACPRCGRVNQTKLGT